MSALLSTTSNPGSDNHWDQEEGEQSRVNGLQGQVVAVMGLGKSGVAAARLLRAAGARVVLVDQKAESALGEEVFSLAGQGMVLKCGENFDQGFLDVDLLVISPGVPLNLPAVEQARLRGIPVIGEVELASRFLPMPIIAVTGTNGKSTTVSLIGRILEESGYRCFVGGNLGVPLSEAALCVYEQGPAGQGMSFPFEMVVVEVSSFQLESIDQFHPHIAVVLNITPDHLDRYASFSEYSAAKAKILERQTSKDHVVLNMDDPRLESFKEKRIGTLWGVSTRLRVARGVYLDGETIVSIEGGQTEIVMSRRDILLPGSHNVSNVLAAVAVGRLSDCPIEAIRRAVASFPGVDHALQIAGYRKGVTFVDDSKGTNPDATIKALESFKSPVVVIMGGKEKGSDFSKLREPIADRAKQVIVIGEAAAELQHVLKGLVPIKPAGSLAEAVTLAAQAAQSGDVVLLSPACASFDMFRDYRDRGEQFQVCVNTLPE